MINFFLIFFLILSTGCSLFNVRQSHYDYLERGVAKKVVEEKSGKPIRRHIKENNVDIYVYGYCMTPYWKEAVAGVLTMGLYTTTCKGSFAEMAIIFQNDQLVEVHDDINAAERAVHNRNVAMAIQQASQAQQTQRTQIPDNRPVESSCTQSGNQMNCTHQKTGFDPSIYNRD